MSDEYILKAQHVKAFRWTGQRIEPKEGEDRMPKWVELLMVPSASGPMLWISAVDGYMRRGDWLIQYADGAVEIMTDHGFGQQFEEKK